MKRLIVFTALLLSASAGHAVWNVTESPIGFAGGPFTITVSTSAWTKVWLATGAVSGSPQNGVIVNNPVGNTASMACVISDVTPTVATTTYSQEIQVGENPLIPISSGLFLYCTSKNTVAERVHAQFIRQQP